MRTGVNPVSRLLSVQRSSEWSLGLTQRHTKEVSPYVTLICHYITLHLRINYFAKKMYPKKSCCMCVPGTYKALHASGSARYARSQGRMNRNDRQM